LRKYLDGVLKPTSLGSARAIAEKSSREIKSLVLNNDIFDNPIHDLTEIFRDIIREKNTPNSVMASNGLAGITLIKDILLKLNKDTDNSFSDLIIESRPDATIVNQVFEKNPGEYFYGKAYLDPDFKKHLSSSFLSLMNKAVPRKYSTTAGMQNDANLIVDFFKENKDIIVSDELFLDDARAAIGSAVNEFLNKGAPAQAEDGQTEAETFLKGLYFYHKLIGGLKKDKLMSQLSMKLEPGLLSLLNESRSFLVENPEIYYELKFFDLADFKISPRDIAMSYVIKNLEANVYDDSVRNRILNDLGLGGAGVKRAMTLGLFLLKNNHIKELDSLSGLLNKV